GLWHHRSKSPECGRAHAGCERRRTRPFRVARRRQRTIPCRAGSARPRVGATACRRIAPRYRGRCCSCGRLKHTKSAVACTTADSQRDTPGTRTRYVHLAELAYSQPLARSLGASAKTAWNGRYLAMTSDVV